MNALSQMMRGSSVGSGTPNASRFSSNGAGNSHDDVPVGGRKASGASPRYKDLDETPVGRSGASGRFNPHDDVPVGRSSASSRPKPFDETPVGRSGASGRINPHDDVPVGRSSISGRPNPFDEVPVGRSGSSARSKHLDETPVGRSGSSGRYNSHDDVPIGRSGSSMLSKPFDEAPVGRSSTSTRPSPYDDIPAGRPGLSSKKKLSDGRSGIAERRTFPNDIPDDRALSYSKNTFDDVPVGRTSSSKGRADPYDEQPVGRSPRSTLSSIKNNFDEVPVGRQAVLDDRDRRAAGGKSGKLSARDELPLGRKGALHDDRRNLDRGRTVSQFDDIPVGKKTPVDDYDRSRLGDRGRSPRQPAVDDKPLGRKSPLDGKDRAKTSRDLESSKKSTFDAIPVGRGSRDMDKRSGELSKSRQSPRSSLRDDDQPLRRKVDYDDDRIGSSNSRAGDYGDFSRRSDGLSSMRSGIRKELDDDRLDRGRSSNFERRGDELSSRRRRDLDEADQPPEQRRRLVRLKQPLPVNLSGTRYESVHYAAKKVGFLPSADDDFRTPFLIWIDNFISTERLSDLRPPQRVNHFPGMAEITRKDLLAKNLAKAAGTLPQEYNFAPRTWILPADLASLQQRCKELLKAEKQRSFISKPIDGAMGHGIALHKTVEDVPQTAEAPSIVQEYVSNPFLIDGMKFDLRLFVLVTSCDPLRVYFYNEGFMRMSCEPYVEPLKTKSTSLLMHLTSPQLQLQAAAAAAEDDRERRTNRRGGRIAADSIRPLRFLNEYLAKRNYDVARMWHNILDLVLKTVFLAYPHVLKSYRRCRPSDQPGSASVCFELLGFDVLLDQNLCPWLMEVNRSPSLDVDHPVEREIKLGLLEETLMLLNCRPSDRKRAEAASLASKDAAIAELARLQARLRQQASCKDVEARVCQGFRLIFPVDDGERQAKLTASLLAAFPIGLDTGSNRLLKELEAFYSNKLSLEEVNKQLASTVGSQRVSDTSDSEDDAAGRRKKVQSEKNQKPTDLKTDSGKNGTETGNSSPTGKSAVISAADAADEARSLLALKCLNELRIRFPGKSDREADRLLSALCSSWQINKPLVGSYWRLSLDSEKRAKILDIVKRCVRVALEKAFRNIGGAGERPEANRLSRLLDRLFNRLLWCNGHGLWETFSGRTAGWEGVIGRQQPTETELQCCRRTVQLCQDCLLTVYLYSEVARPQREALKRLNANAPANGADAALVA